MEYGYPCSIEHNLFISLCIVLVEQTELPSGGGDLTARDNFQTFFSPYYPLGNVYKNLQLSWFISAEGDGTHHHNGKDSFPLNTVAFSDTGTVRIL